MKLAVAGHDEIVSRFRRSLKRGRLPSTFLFVGPAGVGKRAFALRLAQTLLCERRPEQEFDPCGQCPSCLQVQALTHPDLEYIAKPADKSFIPVEAFIGDREHRMREGLCHRISLRPTRGARKVAIIADADLLNQEGANCLLKTLEEPPPGSVIVLIGESEHKQLPTIRSRCQIVRFQPLPEALIRDLLLEKNLVADEAEARRLAAFAEGSMERAVTLANAALQEFREQLWKSLSQVDFDVFDLAKVIGGFVDQAGKEASARRERMRQVLAMAAEFYRKLMWQLSGLARPAPPELETPVQLALQRWRHGADTAAACLERCLDAVGHVDRNANQAALLECWLDDLTIIGRSGYRRSHAPLLADDLL